MKDKGIISYGQHYLENKEIQDVLINNAKLTKRDFVVEVGAGDGRITEKITVLAGKTISYEIDKKTMPVLKDLEQKHKNLEIRFENFLTADIPNANKLVASLPYQITEPFLEKIKVLTQFERITLLVGKSFGQMANKDANIKISKLFLLFNCYFNGEYVQDVDSNNFNPPPKTMSSIINIFPKSKEELLETPSFYIMRELFEQRDKKISNALREAIIRLYAKRNIVKTKREVKQLIQDNFENSITECYLEQMTNEQIQTIFNKISKIV